MPPRLRILLAGLLFSSGGALIKASTFPPLQRAGLRAAIAAILMFLLLPQARRWPASHIRLLMLPFFGASVLFVVANCYTTAASSIFLQSTAPFWIVVLAPILLREHSTRQDRLTLVGIAAGMAMIFTAPDASSTTAPDPLFGNWLALASGLSYALLLIGFRWVGRCCEDDQPSVIAWGSLFAAPVALGLSWILDEPMVIGGARDWLLIAVLGTLQVGVPYVLLVQAAIRVPAVEISLLLMIEPALNPVWTWMVHSETPSVWSILGGLTILASVAAGPVTKLLRKRPRDAAEL
jgi:DME family drug/metabolite transporter